MRLRNSANRFTGHLAIAPPVFGSRRAGLTPFPNFLRPLARSDFINRYLSEVECPLGMDQGVRMK
jgi:hypothetical protein